MSHACEPYTSSSCRNKHIIEVVFCSKVFHRPRRGVTRNTIEEPRGEALMEYDGDYLDQVVPILDHGSLLMLNLNTFTSVYLMSSGVTSSVSMNLFIICINDMSV